MSLCFFGGGWCDEPLEAKMSGDQEISEFYTRMRNCQVCNYTLEFEPLTIFAPINAAFQKMPKIPDDDYLIQYHLTNAPRRLDKLGASYSSINTRLAGGLPIWITIGSDKFTSAYYVNNAKLLTGQSDIVGIKENTKRFPITQVLHKIDEVLVPTRATSNSDIVFNPNAWDFLDNHESFIEGPHRIRDFRKKVKDYRKENIFRTEGGHTFFIPVDEGFENQRSRLIDDYIIDGHVIPKEVLFTTPTKKDSPFPTLANRDNVIRVVISFTQEDRNNTVINYVKSHTLYADGKHTQGVVLAEIVKANIPVKNGVIHLIHKPLMIVDSTITELLQEHMDYICNVGNIQITENVPDITAKPRSRFTRFNAYPHRLDPRIRLTDDDKHGAILSNFFEELNDLGPEGKTFLKTIEKTRDITLFAPCNSALEIQMIQNLKRDKAKFLEIIKMHVVVDNKLYVDTVKKQNEHKVFQAETMVKGKNLYFNVVTVGNNRTMTVEGGGVNATVIQPDLAAKNGIIHIIDRVLGVPYSTVLEKLSTDPMLSDTYQLGRQQQFNAQLNETNKKFTYFVPRNIAWQNAKVEMPSAIKKLFMPDFAYHAFTTLQRHLVISDQVFTMERIKQLTQNESNQKDPGSSNIHEPPAVELPTVRGSLKIFVEEKKDHVYVIHWQGLRIPVFRPNVECTNGIIHVIDRPFLQKGDIRVSSAHTFKASIALYIIAFLLVKFHYA